MAISTYLRGNNVMFISQKQLEIGISKSNIYKASLHIRFAFVFVIVGALNNDLTFEYV